MKRQVYCQKLQKQAEGLTSIPYPGELGQRIYDHISQEAWEQWLAHQTVLINEYHLVPIEAKDRAFLEKSMHDFLFTGDYTKPPAYTEKKE